MLRRLSLVFAALLLTAASAIAQQAPSQGLTFW